MSGCGPGSFWLIPAGDAYSTFCARIEALSGIFDTPRFFPHVTVFSWTHCDVEKVLSQARTLFAGFASLELEVEGMDTSEAFFRTFVVRFRKSEALLELREKLSALQPDPRCGPFEPHLSLLYKRLPREQRTLLPDRYPMELSRVRFEEAWLVTPENPAQVWRDVASWRVRGRFRLAG